MSGNFEYTIETKDFYFKYAKGKTSQRGREFHGYDEIIFYISGGAHLISKNVQVSRSEECVVFVPRENFHQVALSNEDAYLRCILQFRGRGEIEKLMSETCGGVKLVSNPSENTRRIWDFLIKASRAVLSEGDAERLLCSAFSELLLEQKLFGCEFADEKSEASNLIVSAISYIDENYKKNITVKDIADAHNVSVSTISHVFKRELSISVYRYISEKRISAVRELVQKGANLTDAALSCGFGDYSSFYRLYKKQYGESPYEIVNKSQY